MVSYVSGRRCRTLSDDEIVRLYVGGLDSDSIGARANCTASYVLAAVRAAGQTVRPRGGCPRARSTLTADEICRRYREDGESGPRIATAAGITVSSVYAILRRAGIPRRADCVATSKNAAASRRARRAREQG